jgi:hypothetical protein
MKRTLSKLILAVILTALCFVPPAMAGTKTLTFAWEQVVPDDFDGWFLHYGTEPGVYDQKLWIPYSGTVEESYTSDKEIPAPDGQETTFFFALTAVDKSGNASDYSNEVQATLDFQGPADPQNFSVTIKVVSQ